MRPVNLLPEGQRRHQPGGRGGSAYVVVGVLAACLVMVLAYALTARSVNQTTSDTAEVRAEADRLEAEAGSLGPFGDFAAVKETRAASVRQLADARFDWERLTRELARVLPDGAWLQSAEASVSGPGGAAAAPSDGTTTVQPGAKLTGCVPRQPDVATLMVRLGRMNRVEDVVLNESARETDDAQPTFDSCGRYFKYDVDVLFSAAPISESPAGTKAVPASLGGGS